MFRKSNTRLSPATPVALVALFVALGGVSYAAGTTIGTSDLGNGVVTKKKLHRNSVAPGKIINGAVLRTKIRDSAVDGSKVAPDSLGGTNIDESTLGKVPSAVAADTATKADSAVAVEPNGVGTQALQDGAVTAPKLGTTTTRSTTVVIPAGNTDFGSIACLAGERMLAGGTSWVGSFNAANTEKRHIVYSSPTNNGWIARAYNGTGEAKSFIVRAVCLAG
jgi:hypothetical protein